MIKKLFLIFLPFLFFFSCKNSTNDIPKESQVQKIVIAFYPPNSLGDSSDTDNMYLGLYSAAAESNDAFEIVDVCPTSWVNAQTYIERAFNKFTYKTDSSDQGYEALFLFSEGYLPFVEKLQDRIDGKKITVLQLDERESDFSFINCASIPMYGVCYLAGLASRKFLADKEVPRVLAFLANSSDQSLRDGLNGFIDGYNPENWNGIIYEGGDELDDEDPFAVMSFLPDQDEHGYNSASVMYPFSYLLEDYDLIFPLCKGTVKGILKFINEKKDEAFYTVGTYTDMTKLSSKIPFAAVKHTELVVKESVLDWVKNGSVPHFKEYGLKDGYTEFVVSKKYESQFDGFVQQNLNNAILLEAEYESNK